MGGRGPAPKPASQRARTNKDPIPTTVLEFRPGTPLPPMPHWHEETLLWWKAWVESPQAETFSDLDWIYLRETGEMNHRFWAEGDMKMAAEIRQRVAKYGATPEDKARLRMVFADADEKDRKRKPGEPPAPSASRERRGPLRAV